MNGNSSFNGAKSEASGETLFLLEDTDTAMLVLQRTVYLLHNNRERERERETKICSLLTNFATFFFIEGGKWEREKMRDENSPDIPKDSPPECRL